MARSLLHSAPIADVEICSDMHISCNEICPESMLCDEGGCREKVHNRPGGSSSANVKTFDGRTAFLRLSKDEELVDESMQVEKLSQTEHLWPPQRFYAGMLHEEPG